MLNYVLFGITFCTMLITNMCNRNAFNMQHQGTPDQYARCIKEAHSALLREIHGLPFTVVMTGSCTLAGQ